jgi:4-fold beta flower protein
MMDVVRTWSGRYFGWIEEGGLFARDGRHVGEFRKENVFGENGNYLGELRDG